MLNNISIIGVGRLGICVALCLEKVGYNVMEKANNTTDKLFSSGDFNKIKFR